MLTQKLLQVRSFIAFRASAFLQVIRRRSRLDNKPGWGRFYDCLSLYDH
jgi:hypothetical protein